jgi:wyosine [tRNA(Phe)-imidazoG37] synthetase (radical SAM superfamily)
MEVPMESRVLTIDDHRRELNANRYVYAVLSRRSSGISVGINLNPGKACNFDCIYCQVDRTSPAQFKRVDLRRLEVELREILLRARSGTLYSDPPFAGVIAPLRRLTDIAFSGDGEPTAFARFKEAVEIAVRARQEADLERLKIVLITNAALFHRSNVREALELLDANRGEIWAKLDAGTESYYKLVDVTPIPFERVLRNILEAARKRPLVIQSLFMRVHGRAPDEAEVGAYCRRLQDIVERGGKIKLVHVYTVARPPAKTHVTPLSPQEVDDIAARVRAIPLPAAAFYGAQ